MAELWSEGRTAKVDSRLHARLRRRLLVLDRARTIEALLVPGLDFHALHGFEPTRYTIHINGPWCVTFEFENGDALRLDLEQYH